MFAVTASIIASGMQVVNKVLLGNTYLLTVDADMFDFVIIDEGIRRIATYAQDRHELWDCKQVWTGAH